MQAAHPQDKYMQGGNFTVNPVTFNKAPKKKLLVGVLARKLFDPVGQNTELQGRGTVNGEWEPNLSEGLSHKETPNRRPSSQSLVFFVGCRSHPLHTLGFQPFHPKARHSHWPLPTLRQNTSQKRDFPLKPSSNRKTRVLLWRGSSFFTILFYFLRSRWRGSSVRQAKEPSVLVGQMSVPQLSPPSWLQS